MTKKKKVGIRTAISYDLFNNGLFKAKVERSKKSYTRKVKHKNSDY